MIIGGEIMEAIRLVQNFIPGLNSPKNIYEIFRGAGYNKVPDPSYTSKKERVHG